MVGDLAEPAPRRGQRTDSKGTVAEAGAAYCERPVLRRAQRQPALDGLIDCLREAAGGVSGG